MTKLSLRLYHTFWNSVNNSCHLSITQISLCFYGGSPYNTSSVILCLTSCMTFKLTLSTSRKILINGFLLISLKKGMHLVHSATKQFLLFNPSVKIISIQWFPFFEILSVSGSLFTIPSVSGSLFEIPAKPPCYVRQCSLKANLLLISLYV